VLTLPVAFKDGIGHNYPEISGLQGENASIFTKILTTVSNKTLPPVADGLTLVLKK
jgi:hypothetical protein